MVRLVRMLLLDRLDLFRLLGQLVPLARNDLLARLDRRHLWHRSLLLARSVLMGLMLQLYR